MEPTPITGRITLVECLLNRDDGFTRFHVAEHAAAHVTLLGHEATLTIDGRPATFPELLAWLARAGGHSVGTFYPNRERYFSATRAEFVTA